MGATGFVKSIALIGVIVLLTTTVLGVTPSSWTGMQATIEAGINWPEFWNPLTQETVRESSEAGYPNIFNCLSVSCGATPRVVGCENTSVDRPRCLSVQDEDESYLEMQAIEGTGQENFDFNLTNQKFAGFPGSQVRGVIVTLQCKTVSTNGTLLSFFVWWGLNSAASTNFIGYCPMDRYETIVLQDDYPNGVTISGDASPWNQTTNQARISVPDELFDLIDNQGSPTARFTYWRIEVVISTSAQCRPPEGAWFPFLDEVACAIINFANFVWKGIQFLGSGIAYVALVIAAVIGFVGVIVVSMFLGVIEVFSLLFGLGAPTPVQEIIDVIAIAIAAYLIYSTVTLIRGTGAGV